MTSDDDEAEDRSRLRWLVGGLALLALPAVVIWWPGCREYPAVSSPESLALMQLLYTACSAKDTARLDKVERGMAELKRDGKLTPPEERAFAGIVATARDGDWERARKAALKFAEDQVGAGP